MTILASFIAGAACMALVIMLIARFHIARELRRLERKTEARAARIFAKRFPALS
jgi:hypothetical protein